MKGSSGEMIKGLPGLISQVISANHPEVEAVTLSLSPLFANLFSPTGPHLTEIVVKTCPLFASQPMELMTQSFVQAHLFECILLVVLVEKNMDTGCIDLFVDSCQAA